MTDTLEITCVWCGQRMGDKGTLQKHLQDECEKSPLWPLIQENLRRKHEIAALKARIAELEESQ